MRGIGWLLTIFMVFSATLFSQEEASGWFSLQRFSFSLSSTYYFNPWDNYNQAIETVTTQIELDNFFYQPQGEYEKINGDVMFKGNLNYRILPSLSVSLTGQYGSTAARFEMHPDWTVPAVLYGGSPGHRQEFDFDVYSFGLEVAYRYPLNETITLLAAAGLDSYTGKLTFEFSYEHFTTGPLPDETFPQYSAKMDDKTLGWNLALGGDIKLWGPLSLEIAGSYRHAEFSELRGTGQADIFPMINFTAELVEAPNYFGIGIIEVQTPGYEDYALPPLTFFTEPQPEARVPATIDLSSLGIQIGLSVGL